MFVTTTPQAIIDDVNMMTDGDGYNLVSAAQFCARMNQELSSLWQWGRRANRDAFTKVSGSLQMPAGANTMSMSAAAPAGAALTDFSQPRGVDIMISSDNWKKIRLWTFAARDRIAVLSYRFMGDTITLLPSDIARQYPFRVWYMSSYPAVSDAALSTAFSLPDGADEYVKQGMAALVRQRQDDDPSPYLQAQARARLDLEAFLSTGKGDQGAIADVSDEVGPELW
jgi:CelD/BcsL family acetyltransferase involved in cellulose biosynthesis